MANEVEIVITGVNRFGPVASQVSRQAQQLGRSVTESGDRAERALRDAADGAEDLGRSLGGVSTVAGGILAADVVGAIGEKATAAFHSSVTAASDLGESLNAVNKIFGSSAQTILDWGDSNANAFGLSQRAFNDLAVPLGAILKNAGLDMDKVSGSTIELTKRAADMASVFNTDVSEALEAIQAGLKGEADPLERYGVGLSAAAVEQQALADTGKKAASALTNQDKMMASLNLIMKQTKDVAGDFTDTQDGMANATRISNAQIEEAQAKLGQAFLPAMAKAAQVTGTVAEAFSGLSGPVQAVAAGLFAVGTATLVLAPRILATKVALAEMGITARITAASMRTLVGSLAGIGAAVIGVSMLGDAVEGLSGSSKGVKELTKSLGDLGKSGKFAGDLEEQWGVFASGNSAIESFGNAVRETLDPSFWDTYFHHPIDELSAVLPGFETNLESWANKFKEMDTALAGMVSGGKAEDAARAYAKLAEQAKAAGVPIDRLKELFPEYFEAAGTAAKVTEELGKESAKAEKKVASLEDTFKSLTDALFESEDATDAYEAALDDATESIKKNKKTVDAHTEAGRDNRQALRQIAEKAHDVLVSMSNLNQPMATIVHRAQEQRDAFITTAIKMGMTRSAAKKLADQYGLIPKTVRTTIQANTGQALSALDQVLSRIGIVNNRMSNVGAGVGTVLKAQAHGGIIGAAGGGPRSAITLVGEQGPELVNLPFGSNVTPAGTTREMMRSTTITTAPSSYSSNSQSSTVADLTRAITTLADVFDKLTGKTTDSTRAVMAYEAAIDSAKASLKDHKKTLNIHTEAGRANMSALLDLADAAQDVLTAMDAKGSTLEAIAAKAKSERAAFIAIARDMGMSAAAARKLADASGLVPSKVVAAVRKERADTKYNASLPGKASGGIVGGLAWVGEDGPELVDLPHGSNVIPAGTSARMASGGGSVPTIRLEINSGGSRIDDLIVDLLRKSVRVRGGNVQSVLGS